MIRKLEEKDIKKVEQLELSTINSSLGFDMLKSSINDEFKYFYVYEENDILGYISTIFDGLTVEILNFCVDSNYQNKKIGTKLLSYIINYFFKNGAKSFILEVRNNNLRAIHIYEKFGFKKIHVRKNYYANGDDALILEKKMDSIIDIHKAYLSYANYLNDINLDDVGYMHSTIYGIDLDDYSDKNIYKLTKDDAESLYDFCYKEIAHLDNNYANIYATCLKNNLINGNFSFFGIKDNDKLVGLLLVFKYNSLIEIEEIYIDSEYRNKGYFKALFSYVIDYYKKLDVKDVLVSVDKKDNTWMIYEKIGFR